MSGKQVTINGNIILEPYEHSGKIKAKVTGGFASIEQKTNLVGLKLLIDCKIKQTDTYVLLDKGETVWIKEEILHTNPWSTTTYSCDDIEGEFIIAPANAIVMMNLD